MPSFFRAFVLVLCGSLGFACSNGGRHVQPSVEFTTVPEAGPGGAERTAKIAGRAAGIQPGHRVVIYAKTTVWWVQPLTVDPFTRIAADGTWENSTHLGVEYAALLVDEHFRPQPQIDTLPEPGGAVLAVATAKGTGSYAEQPPRHLTFSGYEWEVRQTPSDRGGSNEYDAANAWTDSNGFMHLRLAKREGRWFSAEVILGRSLGSTCCSM